MSSVQATPSEAVPGKSLRLVGPGRFHRSIVFQLLTAMALLVVYDLSKLSDATDRLAMWTVNAVWDFDSESRQEASARIGTILLNQESLHSTNESWPPSMLFHATVLEALLAYEPKSVFLDMLLVDDRGDPNLADLVSILHAYGALGIPVYLAAGRPHGDIAPQILPQLEGLVIPVAGWTERSERDGVVYPMKQPTPSADYWSAAFQIWADACKKDETLRCEDVDLSKLPERDLWVTWPHRVPDIDAVFGPIANGNRLPVSCAAPEVDQGWVMRGLRAMGLASAPLGCGPQLALSAQDVLFLSPDTRNPYLQAMAGRHIIYGFDLQGFQDYVDPATTAFPIPGLFMHATALEILFAEGEGYLSDVGRIGVMTSSALVGAVLVLGYLGNLVLLRLVLQPILCRACAPNVPYEQLKQDWESAELNCQYEDLRDETATPCAESWMWFKAHLGFAAVRHTWNRLIGGLGGVMRPYALVVLGNAAFMLAIHAVLLLVVGPGLLGIAPITWIEGAAIALSALVPFTLYIRDRADYLDHRARSRLRST